MCRNIRQLFNFDPPATDDEIRAAAIQFVRKISGYNAPSSDNKQAFERAVAEVSNAARHLLASGTTGLSVAFDLPTQIGFDSDHPMARGEVGRVGVAIDSIHDMRRLFDGIPLDRVTTSMTINATAAILLALYVALARRRGVPEAALAGILDVRFGGPHTYDGELVEKPWIGENARMIASGEVERVARINHAVCAAAVGIAGVLHAVAPSGTLLGIFHP